MTSRSAGSVRPVAATTLGDLVRRRGLAHPDREALVFPAERATYGALAGRVREFTRALLGLGVQPGERVGILLPASVDLLAMLVAATEAGAIAVPVNARFKSVELEGIITHSGMRVLVTAPPRAGEPDFAELLRRTFPGLAEGAAAELEHVVQLGGAGGGGLMSSAEFFATACPAAEADRAAASVRVRDTALLVYTSGTTAAPKGAMLSHEALTRLADGIAGERMPLTADDRAWTAIPLFHGGGITFALTCLTAGATFVHPRFFDPATTLDLLVRERVTIALAAFETIWLPVLDRPDFASYDLTRIRVVMVVGVPERLRSMAARFPDAVHVSCVAMTESAAFLTLNRLDDPPDKRAETGGHPMPGMQCRVVDPSGDDVGPGVPGELLFRGANTFDGYFRDPDLTARVFDSAGWFHTGDLVVEVPAAFVQLKPGCSATEQELIDHCVGRIASYRVPRYVRWVTEWPMSGTKIKKVKLRKRIADELAAAGITEAPRARR
ncbi:AMP-binding protein [Amycolatopsis sp. NPDC051372]|uniref:class I adenylate-forming enzyme family protein n=1 Tax=unclassified Amycolatopsis TaxID=2618356 RepID=UPI003418BBF0